MPNFFLPDLSEYMQQVNMHSKHLRHSKAHINVCVINTGDGVIDKEEYKNFWFHVGGYPALEAARLDHIYNILTEVCML